MIRMAIAGIYLLAAAFAALLIRRSRRQCQPVENLLLRGMLGLFLGTVALAGLFWKPSVVPRGAPTVFYLADADILRLESERVAREIRQAPSGARVRLVVFGEGGPETAPRREPKRARGLLKTERTFPSLNAALGWVSLESRLATESLAVILSSGDSAATSPQEIPLARLNLAHARNPTSITGIALPAVVFPGRRFDIMVSFQSPPGAAAFIRVSEGDQILRQKSLELPAGALQEPLALDASLTRPGTHILSLDLLREDGTRLERQHVSLEVRSVPSIIYVSESDHSPLAGFLRGKGYTLQRSDPAALRDLQVPVGTEIVILEDLSVGLLPWNVVSGLFRLVSQQGVGILAVGGKHSFGPGQYAGTPMERLLPAYMGLRDHSQEKHKTALVVILDTSGSMLCPPEGCPQDDERMFGQKRPPRGPRVRKIELARQALLNLLPSMKSVDYFGILGVRDYPYWEVEPAPLEERQVIEDRVRAIAANGGGINLYSGLLEAYNRVSRIDADLKHLIVLTDTDDIDEIKVLGQGTVVDIVRLMESKNISVSFIGFGFADDQYIPVLNQLAASTGGYLYLTSDPGEIPFFLTDDHEKLAQRRVIHRHLMTQFSALDLPGMRQTPSLEGQFITEAKADTTTPIWSEIGYPVFAYRRVGRGAVGILAADAGLDMAPDWVSDGALAVWDAMMVKLLSEKKERQRVFFSRRAGEVTAFLDAGRDKAFKDYLGRIDIPGAVPLTFPLEEVNPGIYAADLGNFGPGNYRFAFTGAEGGKPVLEGVMPQGEAPPVVETGIVDYSAVLKATRMKPPFKKRDLRFLLILASGLFMFYEIFREP